MQETFEEYTLTSEVTKDLTIIHRNPAGQIHRLLGPAVIVSYHNWDWYWRDMKHRVGGPADANGNYFLFNTQLTKEAFDQELIAKTMPEWADWVPPEFIKEARGDVKHYGRADGRVHRICGPACTYDGSWTWRWNGMFHRVGGPATHDGLYFLFGKRYHEVAEYELECQLKTNPLWEEYDADLQRYS